MPCTEAYKEHIEYTFNAFCRVVIHYAAINAWRDRDKRRQREISFEYLTEEKFYPFCTSDTYFIDPYKQYPVTICGQRVILTNGNLAEALSSLPEKKREIIYLYFFGRYTQQEIGELYGRCRSTAWHHIHSALQMKWRCFSMRNPKLVPYETIVRATSGEPEAIDEVLRHYSKRIRLASLENGQVNKDTEDNIKRRLIAALFQFRFDGQPT